MFARMTRRLRFAAERRSTAMADQSRPQPCAFHAVTVNSYEGDKEKCLGNSENDRKSEILLDEKNGNRAEKNHHLRAACLHEFAKWRVFNICDAAPYTCVACEKRVWKFWKVETCVGE